MNELNIASNYEALRAIGPWLAAVLDPLDEVTKMSLCTRAELAVHELATNSVDHSDSATGILIRAELTDDSLRVELIDDGDAVDVTAFPEPDINEPQVRGYGMMIIGQLVRSLDYERADQRNVWTAIFDVPNDAHASPTP